jgi:hypothetical protein
MAEVQLVATAVWQPTFPADAIKAVANVTNNLMALKSFSFAGSDRRDRNDPPRQTWGRSLKSGEDSDWVQGLG